MTTFEPDGAYTRRVEQQLRVRCLHLRTKEAFTGLPSAHEREFEADGPVWWCDRTGEALGPDGSQACTDDCHGPGRSCYEPPVRL
jgi:hypothetical protein